MEIMDPTITSSHSQSSSDSRSSEDSSASAHFRIGPECHTRKWYRNVPHRLVCYNI